VGAVPLLLAVENHASADREVDSPNGLVASAATLQHVPVYVAEDPDPATNPTADQLARDVQLLG
jgi:hypothetical protein